MNEAAPATERPVRQPLDSLDPPTFAAFPPKPWLNNLLLGEDGLRAGWGILLFFLLTPMFGVGLGFLVHFLHLLPHLTPGAATTLTPRVTAVGFGLNFCAAALAALLLSLVERRSFACFGFAPGRMALDLVAGLFWGLAALSGLVAVLAATHALSLDGVALHGTLAAAFGLKWLLTFLMVGFFEEFFFRGYLQYTLSRGVAGILRAIDPLMLGVRARSFWIAATLLSVVFFTVAHLGNPGETAVGILGVAAAGLVLVFALYRTGTLWWAIGFHTAWDWAQTCLYGTPDSGSLAVGHILSSHPVGPQLLSGGSAGPEGSLFVLPTLALVGVVIHLTVPKREP